jgi:hypothetical protein
VGCNQSKQKTYPKNAFSNLQVDTFSFSFFGEKGKRGKGEKGKRGKGEKGKRGKGEKSKLPKIPFLDLLNKPGKTPTCSPPK